MKHNTHPCNYKTLLGKQAYKSGKEAEILACSYLEQQGFTIVGTNVRTPFGEIDILSQTVSKDITGKVNLVLVAVEVKTRKNLSHLYYCVGARQQKRITEALLYTVSHNSQYKNIQLRFDVLFVCGISGKIEHISNAWSAV